MSDYRGPRPITEYQTRSNAVFEEGAQFRGGVACEYIGPSGTESERFNFLCDELRSTRDAALSDAMALFHFLETTPPPTICLDGGLIYSLPTNREHARAVEWMREHAHVADDFESAFQGARRINKAPFGGGTFNS